MHRHASVNRIYRLVWNHAANSWVPAAETTRGRGKGSCKALLATTLSLVAGLTEAGPLGGQVVTGSGHIGQDGALTTITQTTPLLSLTWTSFNIAAQETVDFVQPSASAIAVNRITGGNGTQILGHLNANGQVYLINPNGIVFGRGAQVDVGGLVASTLDINDASLGADARSFSGAGSGAVLNQGTINATGDGIGGGYVALLGNHVGNQGTIGARLGTVALGAGSAATLTFNGNSLVHLQVDRSVLNSVAENGGLIRADGGQVIMSAGAKDALLASVVNNTGVIEARTVEDHGGTITLLGGMAAGTVNVAGTLDASAPAGGNGGFIETSAAHVEVADAARITTAAPAGLYGSWLIDPQDYVVAASGGDITGAALSANLANTNEKLQSSAGAAAGSGDINVNDPVSWSANTTLTLEASNNVNVNASITATGNTAGLVIRANTLNGNEPASGPGIFTRNNGALINLLGTNPTLSIAGTSYTVINTLGTAADATTAPSTPSLQGIGALANVTGHYVLGGNIDASSTSTWNAGAGFNPIGASYAPFTGTLDGFGHTINNLFINRPTTSVVGLFGYVNGAHIQNVGLVGGSVTGASSVGALVGSGNGYFVNVYATSTVAGTSYVGGLVGYFNGGTISYSHADGIVSGGDSAGGLVGYLNGGAISNSHAAATVTGTNDLGGLVGLNSLGGIYYSYATGNVSGEVFIGGLVGNTNYASINHVYATGNVTGTDVIGGLIGSQSHGILSSAHATGNVNGNANVGGLVGYNYNSSIKTSYANGAVTGVDSVGGLVGGTGNNSSIDTSYANGAVSGTTNVGGLVGYHYGGGSYGGGPSSITTSYATGAVSGTTNVGGLVGYNVNGGSYGTSIDTSYATGRVTGSSSVGGLVGRNDPYLGTITNAYWNITTTGQPKSAQTDGSYSPTGGLTTSQMQQHDNFVGFNFSTTPGASGNSWVMVDVDGGLNNAGGFVAGVSTPSVPGATFPMLTSEYSTVITNTHQLQLMALAPGANYTLAANIDASATARAAANGSSDVWSTSGGFFPIGTAGGPAFTGTFDGINHTISNLTMNWPTIDGVGLFGNVQAGATIRNVGLIGASVTGSSYVGGLAARNYGSISNSYVTGAVSGNGSYVGGLVAGIIGGNISNSYFTGTVAGAARVGGLAGFSYGTITNSYAAGSVTGRDPTGGLVGDGGGSIIDHSFSNVTINGVHGTGSDAVNGDTSLSTAGMMTSANFSGAAWSIDSNGGGTAVWRIYEGYTAPLLSSFLTPLTVTASNASHVFNGVAFAGNGVTYSATPNANLLGTLTYGPAQGAARAGSYAITPSGLYSNQQGYSITAVSATLTISPLALTGTLAAGTSVYGSPLTPGAVTFSNLVTGYTAVTSPVTVSTAGNLSSGGQLKVGSYMGVESAGSALTGSDAGNYTFAGASGNYSVTPLALSGAIAGGNSVYGAVLAPGSMTFSNAIVGDAVAAGAVTVDTVGHTSTSGNLTAGTHVGSETVGTALSGADAANYTFAGASGNYTVTQLALSGSIADGNSVYGVALAPGAASFSNAIGGDSVAAGAVAVNTAGHTSTSGNFTAGTHLGSETVGSTLTGADAGNYTFAGASGNYTVSTLALSGVIAAGNSVYGATLAPGAVTFNPILGDVVAASAVTVNTAGHTSSSGNFTAGTHVGSETVGTALTGADAGNYTFAGASGNYTVSTLALSGSIADGSSVYGATLAPGAVTLFTPISGDAVAAGTVAVNTTGHTSTSGNFTAGTHVGSETVGTALTGADAGNYTFAGASGNYTVSPLALNVSATGANKTYDGTTAASVTLTGAVLPGDQATFVDGAANFASRNAGANQAVTVTGLGIVGADAANYALSSTSALTAATITPATLTYTATHATSVTGQTPTGLTGSVSGFVADETQADATSGTLAWTTPADAQSHAGVYAIDGTGLTAANYVFVEAPANASALLLQAGSAPPPTPPSPPHPVPVAATMPQALQSTIAQLQATLPAAFADANRGLEPARLLTARDTATAKAAACTTGVATDGGCDAPVTQRTIGTSRTLLHVVDGGVRLSK